MTAPAVFDEPRGTLARQLRVVAGVLLLGIAALAPTSARAECARSYTQGELMQDTQSMTAALRALDEAAFRQSGARMEQNLACMRTKLRPQMQASSYRYVGAYHFLNGNFEPAAGWFRVALEVEPGFEWDLNELALDHPMRRAFDAERPASAESPDRCCRQGAPAARRVEAAPRRPGAVGAQGGAAPAPHAPSVGW